MNTLISDYKIGLQEYEKIICCLWRGPYLYKKQNIGRLVVDEFYPKSEENLEGRVIILSEQELSIRGDENFIDKVKAYVKENSGIDLFK
jgi:hypothetical protein